MLPEVAESSCAYYLRIPLRHRMLFKMIRGAARSCHFYVSHESHGGSHGLRRRTTPGGWTWHEFV
jgi:hypothetical protein